MHDVDAAAAFTRLVSQNGGGAGYVFRVGNLIQVGLSWPSGFALVKR